MVNSVSNPGPRQIGVIKPLTREVNNFNNIEEEMFEKEVIIIDMSERQIGLSLSKKTISSPTKVGLLSFFSKTII